MAIDEMATDKPGSAKSPDTASELGLRELLRWAWRQLTSMRTALILLLLLAIASVPGSVIPQEAVDSLKTSDWKDAHPTLTPIYERLGLFAVYQTPWFAAIYLLLMVSLIGCIVPRLGAYWKAMRAQPPAAPRRLDRMPESGTYADASDALDRAEALLQKRRYRVRRGTDEHGDWVAAERGYLREAGNLLFHLSVLIVLVGFAMGSLLGYRGGVLVLVGGGFTNDVTQYDDFVPGSLFDPDGMEPFSFTIDDFTLKWITSGPSRGQARKFVSHLNYRETPTGDEKSYDLRVNHPLAIGGTELFLIGHGYAPVITVRDGNGDIAISGPTVFLPINQGTFESIGVVKAADAKPDQIGLEGNFYPTYARFKGQQLPVSIFGDALNPAISMLVYTGDLGMDDGRPQSVYALDKSKAKMVRNAKGAPFRVDLKPGQTKKLPDGLGSVTFERVDEWNRIQISRTPGKFIALGGVCLALLGLMGSLFIRPRRVWVRRRTSAAAPAGGSDTLVTVQIAVLDRSGGGEPADELAEIVTDLGLRAPEPGVAATHTEPENGGGSA